jgi:hypothetical protein
MLGWISNAVEAGFDGDGNYFTALAGSLQTPCLGHLGYEPT